jgi:UDP-2-acetamido-2,6-beta-L-arabino-hexul-4-ose reductase
VKILLTGANGFIGKNLQLHFRTHKNIELALFTREHAVSDLPELLHSADWVLHLAGINRPQDPQEFVVGNSELTAQLCQAIRLTKRKIPIIYTSSTQADRDSSYGKSKCSAEQVLLGLNRGYGNPVFIYRLPNVFGKWARPNYNSAVATFCYNTARDLPIQVDDPTAKLTLVYVDDVITSFLSIMDGVDVVLDADGFVKIIPQYHTTVGDIANTIASFKDSRHTLITERVGTGFARALYSTYVSYLPPSDFAYDVPMHSDARGTFVEMLKTPDTGQFSFFTAHPSVTRGGHYHHSKTEKFLVIKGQARFKFRHMHTCEVYELVTSGAKAEIVETVPGWTHDITNIGDDELVVMLWANEVFNRDMPDTFACPL